LVLCAVLGAGWWFLASVAAGGLVVIAGSRVLHHLLHRALAPERKLRDAKVVMAQYYLRLMALGLIIFLLMRLELVHPLGLLVGLSVVVINLLGLAAAEFITTGTSREAV
jgi:hypothetical protein